MVTKRDYNAEQVAAARSVLLELMLALGEYRDELVLVGGWAPTFLIPKPAQAHVGSVDVDLAIDHTRVSDNGYATLIELLIQRGYEQLPRNPASFRKKIGDVTVQVDLMSGEYEGTGKNRRHQEIQETKLRKARGCDIAFIDPESVLLEGELPDGGKDSVRIQVASIGAFLCMKGHALDGRLKEKDAWDIYYCVREYPGGVDALVEQLQPMANHGLMREALEKIAMHFDSPDHRGPRHVADFEMETDPETREVIQRDAYERIQYVLNRLLRH
jgi:predicted nucleotidyltransferase